MWSVGVLSGLLATVALTLVQPDPPPEPQACPAAGIAETERARVRLRVRAADDVRPVIELSRDEGVTWKPQSIGRPDGGFETGWL